MSAGCLSFHTYGPMFNRSYGRSAMQINNLQSSILQEGHSMAQVGVAVVAVGVMRLDTSD